MKITKIEPKRPVLPKRKRVAAYARVSMESERLAHSLSAQISYYSELIQKNPKWEYAGVYADSFISGTDTTKRQEFQRMVSDCEKGLIDIILCKSISRFARNTVDLLETVRHLKDLGIEVQFEKENINSLSGDGELMLTILASFAQEESRSISDNVKWGIRKRFEEGNPTCRNPIFGYEWVNGKLEIIPEEAVVVKRIFQNFLDGKSRLETEREFAKEGITTKKGCRWVDSNIKVVLTNITYTGNTLLQKEYITDPINKKRKKNKGELPKYYIENTHDAIIDLETFQYVQNEMERRKELGPLANKSLNTCCFTGKIKCPYCNISYMHNLRKDRGSLQEYWTCGSRKKKGSTCPISGSIIHQKLIEATERVIGKFTDKEFLEKVDFILVPKEDTLEYHLTDGTIKVEACNKTGHQDCWTEEYRARVSVYRSNHALNRKGATFLTTKLKCTKCHKNLRNAISGKYHYWRCPNSCFKMNLRDDCLNKLLEDMFGEDYKTRFLEEVDHVDISESLTFVFKDEHTQVVDWDNTRRRKNA